MSPHLRHRWPPRGPALLVAALALALAVAACASDVVPPAPSGSTGTGSPPPVPTLSPTPTPTPTATPTHTPRPTITPAPMPTIVDGPELAGGGVKHCPGTTRKGQAGSTANTVSTNWSGYALTTARSVVTCVEAEWVQPGVRCHGTAHTSVSIWVGLGGFNQGRLEQIGTAIDCVSGSALQYSWHESLPRERHEVDAPVPIESGDRVWAQVRWLSGSTYQLSLADLTSADGFTVKDVNGSLRRTEAEWIAEAPTSCAPKCRVVQMPDWGKVTFDHIGVTVNGVHTTLKANGSTRVRVRLETSGGTLRALVTSTAADGRSFVVTWRHA